MRVIKLAALAALLATPALAQTPAYQAPLGANPAAPVVDPLTTGTVVNPGIPARVGGVGENTYATDVSSAKGGNAAMPSRMNPNLGNTSGGPSN